MRTPSPLAAAATVILGITTVGAATAQDSSWTFTEIGVGIKPALAVDDNNVPHIGYLTEAIVGGVFYATNQSGSWQTELITEGYFYGPVDIDVTGAGAPYIGYHDHEAASFDPSLGSGVLQIKENGAWVEARVENAGHDQWDTDVAVDGNGAWHMAGIDPAQFGAVAGLEYVTNAFGDPQVEEVGSGPQPYEFGTSIELAPDGRVGISYFDASPQDIRYAERGAGPDGEWAITTLQTDGDVGRYSDLAYDADGNPHISYWAFESPNGGTVRYAWRDDGGVWQIEDVGTMSNVVSGFTGARKITAVEVDADGTPHVMYGDRAEIAHATRGADGSWTVETVFQANGRPLGQLVEFALDGAGKPHLTYFEVTQESPLEGVVFYGTTN